MNGNGNEKNGAPGEPPADENGAPAAAETVRGNSHIQKVPALTFQGMLVFPYTLTPLVIEGEKSIKLVDSASAGDRLIAVFPEIPREMKKPDSELIETHVKTEEIDGKKVSRTGVLVRIVKLLKFPDGTVRALVRGLSRIKYISTVPGAEILQVIAERVMEPKDREMETIAMARNALSQFQEIIKYAPNFPEELKIAILNVNENVRLVDLVSDSINISFCEKLCILNLPTVQERLQLLTILLNREVEVLRLGAEIQSQVHNALTKSQREFFLREQLKTIKEELGEESKNPDILKIEEAIKKLTLPENVMKIVTREKERLETIPQASSEYHVAHNYIDWILSVPWGVFTEDRLDAKEAAKILDDDHYGLKDIKERILEFLAVLQLKKDKKSPILCFVGPPGVGKTSLGQSIARATGRKFVRMSLGGIKDEAEIRGHRRTYVGALPGRIIQGMKKAGSSNPVFMLDEIDKVGNDFRGDPASALLEVLDPQQNHAFNDHFLELDFDLSSVMFIATANVLDTIPGPLIDRMEIIRLPGYTAVEKKRIAEQFLIPRQTRENGLLKKQIGFTLEAVDELINYYTREAGVRNLERSIGSVCRKTAKKIVDGELKHDGRLKITAEEVRKLLGARKYTLESAAGEPEVGVATGMAWTGAGGSILPVEAIMMPGKGDLKLTGSLGDVMKESGHAAFSFIKSTGERLKIKEDLFKKRDFHVHVPDGATPKDGPSAGVTIATALVSLMTGKPVKKSLSMTGEITLRGKVTAVGGIKEKVIAALRSGVKTVLLPEENRKDLEDIPDDVKKKLKFHFVSSISEALDLSIGGFSK
jgi:ATP-dependent Lon protease